MLFPLIFALMQDLAAEPVVDPPPPSPPLPPPAPIGHAAPPTESARTRPVTEKPQAQSTVRAGLEIFSQYSYRNTNGDGGSRAWFHQFDVPRAHGAVEGEWDHVARGRLVIEATRSAAEGSLIGVAGDSLVLRLREAFGAYRPIESLEISGGVIPTLTVPELDGTWMLRPVAPSGLEANGLMSPADLGAKARFDLPRDYGWIATSAYNGEGYNSRELNRGKNVEGAVEIHPLAGVPSPAREQLLPLGVFASYAFGSSGVALARADRLNAGLVWQGSHVRAGAFFTYAWGVAEFGRQRAMLMTAFARVEPVNRLLVGARFDHIVRDADPAPGAATDAVSTIWGTVGYRIVTPLESFLALTRSIPTTRAQTELPGSNAWDLRVIGRVVF